MRLKRAALKALTVGVSLVVGLLLAELGLRVSGVWIGRHSDTMFTVMEYDSVLGWKMKPNANEKIDLVDVENIPVRSNSEGFWDGEFREEKAAGKCRIAFLGDSYTWGMGVREEERFTNLLARGDSSLESFNFGLPGFGTDQSLLVWQHIASRYKPDVVVMTVYQNDYVDNMHVVRSGRRKPYFEWKENAAPVLRDEPVDTADFWSDGVFNQVAPPYVGYFPSPMQKRSRVLHWLVKYSDLARFAYTVMRGKPSAAEQDGGTRTAPAGQFQQTAASAAELSQAQRAEVGLMETLLEELAGEVRAQGAECLIVFAGEPNPQYEAQKQALGRAGINYLDATTGKLAITIPGGGPKVYFPFNRHWTPEANRAVAALLAERLREGNLCGRGGQTSAPRG